MNFRPLILTKHHYVGVCHLRALEFWWEVQVVVHHSQVLEDQSFLLSIQRLPLYCWSITHSTLWTHCSSSTSTSASPSHLTRWHPSSCYWIASCRWITSAWSCVSTTWSLLLCLPLPVDLSSNLQGLFLRKLPLWSVGTLLPDHGGQFQKLRSWFIVLRCKVFLAYPFLNLVCLFLLLARKSSLRLLSHNIQVRVVMNGIWNIREWTSFFWFLGSRWVRLCCSLLRLFFLRFWWLLLVFSINRTRFKFFTVNNFIFLLFRLLFSFFCLSLVLFVNLRIRIGVWIKQRAYDVIHLLNIFFI